MLNWVTRLFINIFVVVVAGIAAIFGVEALRPDDVGEDLTLVLYGVVFLVLLLLIWLLRRRRARGRRPPSAPAATGEAPPGTVEAAPPPPGCLKRLLKWVKRIFILVVVVSVAIIVVREYWPGVIDGPTEQAGPDEPDDAGEPPIPERVVECNTTAEEGGDTAETIYVDVGDRRSVEFWYNMYGKQDRIRILYGGDEIFDSRCVSKERSEGLRLDGSATRLEIRVEPNCAGRPAGTKWNFRVVCPGP